MHYVKVKGILSHQRPRCTESLALAFLLGCQFPDAFPIRQVVALGDAYVPACTFLALPRRDGVVHQVAVAKVYDHRVFGKRDTYPRCVAIHHLLLSKS